MIGTGMSLSSPSKQSPWAARYINDFRDVNEAPDEFSNVGKAGEQYDVDAQKIGLELSRQLKKSIESISDALSLIENQKVLHLGDIDTETLTEELIILTYVGQRLALQVASTRKGVNSDKMREICNTLDSYALKFIDNSPEFENLLDQRGEFYHQLLSSHADTIRKGDWGEFLKDLGFRFEQFCRGGGGENGPFMIGDFFSTTPLMMLANQYWSNGFTKTVEFLKTQEPL